MLPENVKISFHGFNIVNIIVVLPEFVMIDALHGNLISNYVLLFLSCTLGSDATSKKMHE